MNDRIGPLSAQMGQRQCALQFVESARSEGLELVGPDGVLAGLTKAGAGNASPGGKARALGGSEAHDPAGRHSGNSRNDTRSKTVTIEIGPVEIDVLRDREASFEPQLVHKRQRRLSGIDEMVLPLSARGLTTGEIAAHCTDVDRRHRVQASDFADHR